MASTSIDQFTSTDFMSINKFHDNACGYVAFKRTYARTRANGESTEEWDDLVERMITGCRDLPGLSLTADETADLRNLLLQQKCIMAGRFLFQLGTDNVKKTGLLSLQNCSAVVIDKFDAFVWSMRMLMFGAGVGFNIQRRYVSQLPVVHHAIATRTLAHDADFIVPDSRDGWCQLFMKLLRRHFKPCHAKRDFTYSTVLLRSKGAPIKTFGGIASGPEVLCDGMNKIQTVLNRVAGRGAGENYMRPIDCLDIMNIVASIVVAGNVRRSATIALGDPDDVDFLRAKRWDLAADGVIPPIPNYRCFSNNSVVCSDLSDLHPCFWETYSVPGEPLGLINLELMKQCGRIGDFQYPDPDVVAVNPCGE